MSKLSFLCVGVLGLILTIVSCQSAVSDGAVLKPTGDSITFSLNPKTTVLIRALFSFEDEEGREYLTFQNDEEP
ncbi:MAG: hypothetical protein RSO15_17730 [Bacteroides sp.]|uniref:hypothetical protein n=1 Tax=Bacteroides sp. TaxID=29523 RepID=UPI002FCAB543